MKLGVAAAAAALLVGAQAATASAALPAPAGAATAAAHRIAHRLSGWTRLKSATIQGDRRCVPFEHDGQLAHATLVFESRNAATPGLSVAAAVSVYRNRAAARRALAESASPAWQRCTRAYFARMVRPQGLGVTARDGVAAWARPPAGSRAVAEHLVARLESGAGALWNSTYELEDTHDPRVVYGFSLAGERPIPQSLVRSLLALAG
ncbi:MAG TPA: hypothetical protein VFL60_08180 [Gaiellaceae bacterium]|nr:hypothetical protein [Gaiellaceae bacterium]